MSPMLAIEGDAVRIEVCAIGAPTRRPEAAVKRVSICYVRMSADRDTDMWGGLVSGRSPGACDGGGPRRVGGV